MFYYVYRIEDPTGDDGLWYNRDGVRTDLIKTLTNAKCKDLPMPFDEELYSLHGLAWISATDKLEEIPLWCSPQDLAELAERGMHLYRFTVSHYREVPGHVVFAREHVYECIQLPLSVLD